ncbi:multidrug effflux MFS transporter [Sulfitobacter aestuarii]|uniref:Multidrug effflux MFS transporter n=1 Tax=Sulfitobacter aestuarii TaxID=2161676 RepID=A0ABW5U122_9RHOB
MTSQQPEFRMGRAEFIALIAMMFATIAFSIDAMLPALPEMGAELAPEAPHRAGLILTAFVFGMGLGTFFTGPLSDAFGRKNVIYAGAALYIIAAAVGWASNTLEVMLVARVFQGLGAAGPRVVSLAIIRDLFSGREMARIMSIVMMVFTLVPAFAPAMGAAIIAFGGWHGIFFAFIVFSLVSALWMGLRLPETLPVQQRRPLRLRLMMGAVHEMFAHPSVRLSIMVQTLALSMLFVTLMLVQPIYDQIYDRGESFPFWFGLVALISGSASLLNALLVVRYGMRRLVSIALGGQILLSGAYFLFDLTAMAEPYGFAAFVLWQTCLFFQAGLTLGNLNAIAMEPMGHIAGMAASVTGAVSTVLAALIASPVGLLFDGSTRPLVGAVLLLALVGFALMLHMGRVEARLAAAE